MSTIRTQAQEPVPEKTAFRYTATLKKEDGTALGSGDLSTLTLTLYAPDTTGQQIVNSISATNILNTGRGTIDVNGALVVTLAMDDLQVLAGEGRDCPRVMLIQGTWAGGTRATRHEVGFIVQDMDKVA